MERHPPCLWAEGSPQTARLKIEKKKFGRMYCIYEIFCYGSWEGRSPRQVKKKEKV